ncbi:bifunctional lysylphosphatidylglycerol flippase/synthetase MprF [Clostridium sp. DSM 100503]|uniref:bifunctional lysylphosphatidylglycerol flippase/synthetase MprF n=1 Tax=Clostridium sp. DSM 100503 TaxID=2963282 RepID=UPI002149A8E9|nr:bifunctional lysylphosphatidylglycerol flippase/synthetase MprF [Clostridium sp. DSM 100503]MCR1951294.1 bifunctional lysylphosphatidylglycerol flippase/synthetase MprF [Clostridium sp. DSM 100503]
MKINKKVVKVIQIVVISVILFFAFRELYMIFKNIDKELFYTYSDRLKNFNIFTIAILGIISYVPLTFYDLLIKKKVGIKLSWKQVYKYSWIASSIANIAGFGGSTAIFLKNYFYRDYVEDSSKLVKEVSKVVGLNLSGFSLVCLIYSIWNIFGERKLDIVFGISTAIGLYIPIILCWATYILYKNRNKENYFFILKIMSISILEWCTTIVLIYGLIKILKINITITQFFPIYVMAIIFAMISMIPGGFGSFDLTLLLGLKEFNIPSEQVLLLILLYRLSYYVVPIIIGIALFVIDLYMKINHEAREVISRINSKIAQFTLSMLILANGLYLIFFDYSYVERYLPDKDKILNIDIAIFSIFISVFLGFILIVISTLISSKSRVIYYAMIGVLGAITFGVFFDKYIYHEYILLAITWVLIIFSRKRFYRKGFIFTWKSAIKCIIFILIILSLYILLTNKMEREYIVEAELENLILAFEAYKNKEICLGITGAIGSILLVIFFLKFNKFNKFPKEKLDIERVEELIQKYGGSRLIHYVFLDDKYIYINENEDVLFQYQISGDKIIILGNPVGNRKEFFDAIREFLEKADLYGYTLAFCGIDSDIIPELHDLGYEFMKIGQDAIIELDKFSLEGKKNKSNRQAIGRIEKAGYKFSVVSPPLSSNLFEELKDVSDEWLNGQVEKGFCVGFLDREYIERDKIVTVRNSEGELKGFASIMPMYDDKTLSVDLMRFKKVEVNGIMDYMFANIFLYGKQNGFEYFNLGLAPLADVGRSKYAFLREQVAYQIFVYGNSFYSFKGLKRFKDKYASKWDDRYLAYKKGSSVIITIIQLMRIISKKRKS